MSSALQRAHGAVQKAQADVTKWTATLNQLQPRHAALEATLGATVLDDPSAAEKLIAELTDIASRTTVAERAVAVATDRVRDARRAVLLAEADEDDAAATAAEREAQKVTAAVAKALKTLEEVDGATWVRFEARPGVEYIGGTPVERVNRAEVLNSRGRFHQLRAAVTRHVHTHGRRPRFGSELAGAGGLLAWAALVQIGAEHTTDGARAYLALPEPEPQPEPLTAAQMLALAAAPQFPRPAGVANR